MIEAQVTIRFDFPANDTFFQQQGVQPTVAIAGRVMSANA